MNIGTRKLIWSVPLAAVFAVVGALAIFMTLQPNSALAQAEEIPGMPMKPTAQALGPSSIELMWEAPTTGGTPDGYRIDYSDDGKVWYSLEPNHDSTVFTDDKDLMAVQKRYYRIFAFNSGGSSSVLSGISATTDKSMKADAPTNIEVTAGDGANPATMTKTQITLTWTAPEDPDGAPVKKYKIEVSKDGRSFSKLAEQTPMQAMCTGTDDSCTYTHEGLLEMQERWYRVSATNYPNGMGASAVESAASVAKSVETEAGVIPAAPQNLRAGVNPAGRMWLYWDEPNTDPDDGGTAIPGAPIVGYYIHGGPAGVTDGHMVSKLHFVEASTSLALTTSVLNKFDKPDADDNETWMFNVTAVNSVVRRNLEDGMAATADANFTTPVLDVDNAKDTTADDTEDDLLNRPTLTVNRINNVNAGRTDITVKWKVEKLIDSDTATDGIQNTNKQYRIERSEDRIDWENITPTTTPPVGAVMTMTDMGRTAGTTYHYRVFAEHNKDDAGAADTVTTWTEASLTKSVTTAPAGKPNAPMSPSATAASETQIDVAWTEPGMNGSPEVGHGKVTGYEIDVSDDGKTWSLLTTVAGDKMEYEHKGLVQGQTKYYRVSTINNAPGSARRSVPTDAVSATTLTSFASDSPGGLVAKAMGRTAIELLWNARAFDITAAPITGYKIESSPLNAMGNCAEDWTVLMADTMSTTTAYTHSGLAAETGRCYRVFGINIVATSSTFVGHGDQYVVTNDNDAKATTDPAVVPGMPMSVMAEPTSDTAIKVAWKAPADNGGADITGYVLERKSGDGDFMVIAATNAATWWNMLDCEAMNDAVPADSTPAPGADDSSSPYCKMYDGLSADAKKVVDATFTANYGTITGMMYSDMDLTPMTKYYYRVKAANSVGDGMPSDGMAYAMTDTSNTAPTEVGEIADVTVTAGQMSAAMNVSGYFNDVDEGDTLSYSASSSNEAAATANIPDGSNMLTISGVAAGSATITVTATDAAGATASQPFMVTVEAARVELMAPTNIRVNPVGSGGVIVAWDPVSGANGYRIIAVNVNNVDETHSEFVNNPTSTGGGLDGLTAGQTYNVFVASFDDQDPPNYKLQTKFRQIVAE